MKILVDKFTDELKSIVNEKILLLNKRDTLSKRLKAGEAYFSKRINNPNPKEIEEGINNVLSIMTELSEIEQQVKDLDIIIVSKIEAYSSNFIAKVKMPERLNDVGDLIKHDCVYAVPFNSGDDNLKEVTPDDIWFLKMVKQAFKATNVTFIDKGEF